MTDRAASRPPIPPDIAAAAHAAAARVAIMPLRLVWLPAVVSTMDVVERAAADGAPQGLVVVADEQTGGRGRRGRTWSSPPGAGLYFSLLLRPVGHLASAAAALITLAMGVAIRDAVAAASGLAADLKWPNDLMVGRRKLAGILTEGVGVGTSTPVIIVGVGINVLSAAHSGEAAARATSIESELGRGVDRALVLEEALVATAAAYGQLQGGGADDILRRWRLAAPSADGATVEWQTPGGVCRGITRGVDEHGALLVQSSRGLERIVGGELHWR